MQSFKRLATQVEELMNGHLSTEVRTVVVTERMKLSQEK